MSSSPGCDKNFHKKCAYHIPNNCSRLGTSEGVANSVTQRPPQEVWSGRPLWIDRTLKSRPQVPHTFFVQTLVKPTVCFHCKKLVRRGRREGEERGGKGRRGEGRGEGEGEDRGGGGGRGGRGGQREIQILVRPREIERKKDF